MVKTMILASFLMAFTFIAIPTSSAYAHCGTCPKAQKPCEKTLGQKAPCEKCAKAKAHYKATGEKKPCVKCAKAKAHYKAKEATSSVDHSAKGSLTMKSRYGQTGGTASYN